VPLLKSNCNTYGKTTTIFAVYQLAQLYQKILNTAWSLWCFLWKYW